MTAEIAIMNREAIALAADSAVTITTMSEKKIFTSANKLFALSKYHPVGIMIYGNALFMDVPWETIIKVYRKKLGAKKFETLEGYAEDFINFLSQNNPMFPKEIQMTYFKLNMYSYLNYIKRKIGEQIDKIIEEKGEICEKEIKQIVSEIIGNQYKIWKDAESAPSIPDNFNEVIINNYNREINKAIRDSYGKVTNIKKCKN